MKALFVILLASLIDWIAGPITHNDWLFEQPLYRQTVKLSTGRITKSPKNMLEPHQDKSKIHPAANNKHIAVVMKLRPDTVQKIRINDYPSSDESQLYGKECAYLFLLKKVSLYVTKSRDNRIMNEFLKLLLNY